MYLTMTDWFPPEVKPMRVGVYQAKRIDSVGPPRFRYFNGIGWGLTSMTIEGAERLPSGGCDVCNWRGVANATS